MFGKALKAPLSSVEGTIKVRLSRQKLLTPLKQASKLQLLLWLSARADGRRLRQRRSGASRKSLNEEHERVPGTSEPHSYSCHAWRRHRHCWKHPKIPK